MKFGKHFKWFYFDGEAFRDLNEIADSDEEDGFIVSDEKILGKTLFEASTSRQGSRGWGGLYLATPEGTLRIGEPSDFPKFMELFSPQIISAELCGEIERLLRWKDSIKDLIPSGVRIRLPETSSDLFNKPTDYLAKIVNFKEIGRKRSITQMSKLLHQAFVLFKIPKVMWGAEIINKDVFLEQEMKCRIKNLDLMMPLSWAAPTMKVKYDNNIYSIWHEASVPYPLNAEDKRKTVRIARSGSEIYSTMKSNTTRRFDIVVQKRDRESLFSKKPKYREVEKMNSEEFFGLPNVYFEDIVGKIDLLIECKEQAFEKWEQNIDEQVIDYFKTYKPTKMSLISAFPVPDHVVSKLKKEGIETVAPFGLDETQWNQEDKFRSLIEAI
ncbi:MAG: hypothetical protein MOIL_01298 [Candidatus Methanolliviera sp. GoM_oil]|nr:MAG: hypothetical protein MOIL_01298 [Candidatus Methanolliviera sp. GoM_oil]